MCICAKKDNNIQTPVPFAQWNRQLFAAGTAPTCTHVRNNPNAPNAGAVREAYGWDGNGFPFYVSMSAAQEAQFNQLYTSWKAQQPPGAIHQYKIDAGGDPPPGCGTPSTPSCG